MRILIALVIVVSAAFILDAALAFPDGAPWGAANPAADQHCATCHFEAEPVRDSAALVIDGLPAEPQPGVTYTLNIIFEHPDIVTAGFQLIAHAGDAEAGTFFSDDTNIETIGAAVRSTAPLKSDERISWSIEWHAPDEVTLPLVFYVAATAANDDGSPFGDTIHYRSYNLPAD